ncbi:hypothetical protein [Microbulbifer variabilis]|uniref:hypothetical protein n=1 Tax=Microbulbifer variabilis TaxID=266805 RepID=UPI000370D3BA|nr:hypothetical protein [Microbulbifer variabilis]
MTQEASIYDILRDAESEIKKQLIYCIPLLFLAGSLPIMAWYSFLIPNDEPSDIWFQRSGSLMVLFAVWAEYNLMKVNEHINLSGSSYSQQSVLAERYKTIYNIAQYSAAVLAILGTFIWGYGDVFNKIIISITG